MNAYIKKNRRSCIISIVLCSLTVLTVFAGLIVRFFLIDNETVGAEGIGGFRMFTILSNIVVGVCASQAIPYAVDGLRYNNYHLPRWIVDTLYVGVGCVTVTFLLSCFVISPVFGIKYALFDTSNIYLHLTSPVLAAVMFIFFNNYHNISFKKTLIALIPPYVYAAVYVTMVFFVDEANGGWIDFYMIDHFFPWQLSVSMFLAAVFLILTGLRLAHNARHKKAKAAFEEYYMTDEEYALPTIEDAIARLAIDFPKRDGDPVIPRRIILVLMKRYKAPLGIGDYMKLYLDKTA